MAYEGGGGQMGLPGGKNGNGNGKGKVPTLTKKKGVGYNATTSDQIFAISSVAGATTKESMPKSVEIENSGRIPLVIMAGYETYSDDTSDGVTEYLHTLLPPGEVFNPPLRAVIRTGESTVLMDGTAVDNAAPDSNEYVDSGADTDDTTGTDNVDNSASNTTVYLEPYASAADCTANLFRVGDLIRIRDEVMKVPAIGDKSDLANNKLTVTRGEYGSTATTNTDDDDPVRLPFFNAYYDYDAYSVAQTDFNGKFKCFNFFGLGRSATETQGIVPGSVCIKYYEAGYQALGMSGINSSTHSGLAASTEYEFDIQVDGGSNFDNLSFTTDSSNLRFGGTNGVLNKIQAALNIQFYTAGNLFQKKVTVGIVDGDIRFTSGTHLSTSAIALTAGSTGTAELFGTGRGNAVGSHRAAVGAKLPDDVTYDNVTYGTIPNTKYMVFDDGSGNLFGASGGTINYETGAVDIQSGFPNAEFVVSCLHSSAFSGKITESETDRINCLVSIDANVPNQKTTGKVTVRSL